ncbi:metal-dependent transcriptional regulator [Thiomicrorhabdus lithotrophica]|uniref:Transcriptional regulator MntR n=1 Tax=Thiomicrorhabdus lithotrophica TaxID=2949997 RepID=A0ABY8CC78_9GAMM|nr:metal-dependent transcriptional regulator [Thiomicrorhabdus lithotrophica]WEJ61728.1 metal-dependent transcriptional regulator [Thiomicrorhabdus lithotrophica]
MASQALEDYLKIIYKLEDSSPEDKGVQTSVIAERLSISQASVSNMIKKLADKKYISYAPYYGVTLTDSGRKIALNMIRKHRILEQYLVERLNYSWDEVDEEAEVLEHAISDTLANRMWDDLGQPTHDPHGSPIPSIDGELIKQDLIPLIDVLLEQPVQVKRIKNRSPEELRYLANIGLTTGVVLKIKNMAPLNGPLLVEIEGRDLHAIDYRLAMALQVTQPEGVK